jgi:uncharacterized protein YggE
MKKSTYFKFLVSTSVAVFIMGFSTASLADANAPFPRILVNGEGRVDIAPDMAILSLTVTREADTARSALDTNSAAMNEVIAAMKAEGIDTRDLKLRASPFSPATHDRHRSLPVNANHHRLLATRYATV